MSDQDRPPADRRSGLERLRGAAETVQNEIAAWGRRIFWGSPEASAEAPSAAAADPMRMLYGRFTGRTPEPDAPSPPASPPPPPAGRGGLKKLAPDGSQFLASNFTNDAGARPYKLFLPSGYRGQRVPLVVMLHGCTQSPDDFATGTGMNALAEEHNFLVAYPGQTVAAHHARCWNWYNATDQLRGGGEPSLIAGITQQIMRVYRVDPRRVYLAGMSAGGALAATLGATYPELYAAIGVHSGLAFGAARDLASAFVAMQQGGRSAENPLAEVNGAPRLRPIVPAIVFHGDRDNTVSVRNADDIITAASAGLTLTRTVEESRVPDGYAFRRTVYADRRGESVLEQWIVFGEGHAWSGGNPAASFTDPRGPNASREMLRFFLTHQGPGR